MTMVMIKNENDCPMAFGADKKMVIIQPGEEANIVMEPQYEEMLETGAISLVEKVEVVVEKAKRKRPKRVEKEE